jgi:hypothetical protein
MAIVRAPCLYLRPDDDDVIEALRCYLSSTIDIEIGLALCALYRELTELDKTILTTVFNVQKSLGHSINGMRNLIDGNGHHRRVYEQVKITLASYDISQNEWGGLQVRYILI